MAYQVTGNVTRLGLAGAHRVALINRATCALIATTTSATNGSYTFSNVAFIDKGYCLIAFDDGADPVNAAVSDYVTPKQV